jgi:hypothetical protein
VRGALSALLEGEFFFITALSAALPTPRAGKPHGKAQVPLGHPGPYLRCADAERPAPRASRSKRSHWWAHRRLRVVGSPGLKLSVTPQGG